MSAIDEKLKFEKTMEIGSSIKTVRVFHCDLMQPVGKYDALISSSFCNNYTPYGNTLMANIAKTFKEDVDSIHESRIKEYDGFHVWLSEMPQNDNYRYLINVEIFSLNAKMLSKEEHYNIIRKRVSALFACIRQANYDGLNIRKIALPIIGTGKQNVEIKELTKVLFDQCKLELKLNDDLETIDFYERSDTKVLDVCKIISEMDKNDINDVFVSYSHKDTELVEELASKMKENKIVYWIDYHCLKSGKKYPKQIKNAISKSKNIVLIVSNNSCESKWVIQEIDQALNEKLNIFPVFLISLKELKQQYPDVFDKINLFQGFEAYKKSEFMEALVKELKEHCLI